MKCEHCGQKNRKRAKFCGSCGEQLNAGRSIVQVRQQRGMPKRRSTLMIAGLVAGVLIAAGVFFSLGHSARAVGAVDGLVRISLAEVNDGRAHYFKYDARGTDVTFFVLRASDGVIRAALDTCDVCYKEKAGYRQEGDVMVCNNCEKPFPSMEINVQRGGCNPVPLDRRIEGAELVLDASELERCAGYFVKG